MKTETQKIAAIKYTRSEKGKERARNYYKNLSPEEKQRRYEINKKYRMSPQGKEVWKKYITSDKGKALLKKLDTSPERIRKHEDWRIRKFYKISLNDYESMLKNQNGVCAICRKPPINNKLGIDHDRACCSGTKSCGNCIRELLCLSCNTMLGQSKDSIVTLEAAIGYLKNHGKQ